jgi:UDP-N-acetylglucosamine:LPS N-acetylglucosamine transferase
MTKKIKILIATGGTGGHVFPAYSLASYFVEKNYNITNNKKKYSKNIYFNLRNFIFYI